MATSLSPCQSFFEKSLNYEYIGIITITRRYNMSKRLDGTSMFTGINSGLTNAFAQLTGQYSDGVTIENLNKALTKLGLKAQTYISAIKVKSVVDATGDCDIAWFADAPTDTFKQGNGNKRKRCNAEH